MLSDQSKLFYLFTKDPNDYKLIGKTLSFYNINYFNYYLNLQICLEFQDRIIESLGTRYGIYIESVAFTIDYSWLLLFYQETSLIISTRLYFSLSIRKITGRKEG